MSSHYVSGRNGIDHPVKSFTHTRKGTAQITATQSVDTDDETLAVLSVSCGWQMTAGDAAHRADERRETASPGINPGRCGGSK